MARTKKKTEKEAPQAAPEPPSTQPIVSAHSYVEIRYPRAVEKTYHWSGQAYKEDFVKLLPRDEALDFARAVEQASKEVL